jgi:hypothetical protein
MFVRIQDNKVVEFFPYESLTGRFHPDIIAMCYSVDEEMPQGQYVTTEDVFADVEVESTNEEGETVIEIVNQKVGQRAIAAEPPAPVINADLLLAELRIERNRRIALTDWTQFPDAPLSQELKAAYVVYRQALRDLPKNVIDLTQVEWPVEPR